MFQKGQPRPPSGGRKKGSRNKKKVARVADYLSEKELNPVEEILKLMAQIEEAEIKAKIWLDLLSYTQPKPKEIDMEDDFEDDEEFDQLRDVTDSNLIDIATGKKTMGPCE